MIVKYYKVEVAIPEDVLENFAMQIPSPLEYQRRTIEATKGAIESGTDTFNGVEHATFYSKTEAEECEQLLIRALDYFRGLPNPNLAT